MNITKKKYSGFLGSCIRCSVYIVPLLACAVVNAAQPVISNVTGTINTGQILTITGANMVNEDITKWSSFFTIHPTASGFEGTSPASDGYGHTIGNSIDPVYDTNIRLMGSKSIKFSQMGASASNQTSYITARGILRTGIGDIWIRFYAKWVWSGAWAKSHIKMIDTFGIPGQRALQNYFQPSAGLARNMILRSAGGMISGTPTPNNDTIYYPIPGGLSQDKWYEFELHFKNDVAPYIADGWMDGTKIITSVPKVGNNIGGLMLGLVNMINTDPNSVLYHYWDGFATSTSRVYPASMVEISNNSTYGQGTVKYQEPIYFSDSSIQFKADFTGLGGGSSYLWVTNNRQERSSPYYLGKAQ
jgi:hypothetical protein